MKSIGKTYLINIEISHKEETAGNIILPQTGLTRETIHYIGRIFDYGIGFTEEEKKTLIPIGTKVLMNYKKDVNRIKLIIEDKIYYIYNPEDILGIIEE